MRTRTLLSLALLTLTTLTSVSFPAHAAEALSVRSGWWNRNNTGVLGSLPGTGPESALRVAGDTTGPSAIAAVRLTLPQHVTSIVLRLTSVEDGELNTEGAVVLACPTRSAWTAGDSQVWDKRPRYDCDNSVQAVHDGMRWTFSLASLVHNAVVDIALVPGTTALAGVGEVPATFQVSFAAPTTKSVDFEMSSPPAVSSRQEPEPTIDEPSGQAAPVTSGPAPVGAAIPAPTVPALRNQPPGAPQPEVLAPQATPDMSRRSADGHRLTGLLLAALGVLALVLQPVLRRSESPPVTGLTSAPRTGRAPALR